MNRYITSSDKIIGKGTYGQIYCAYDSVKQTNVALKRNLIKHNIDGISALPELDISMKINHPHINSCIDFVGDYNIATLKKSTLTDDKIHLIYPLMDGCIGDFIYSNGNKNKCKITTHNLIRIMYQSLCGLYALHSQNIAHRDIKPSNILYNMSNKGIINVKISDFGMSLHLNNRENGSIHVINNFYKPLEIIYGNVYYTTKVDIWSLGCTFYEIANTSDLFTCKDDNKFTTADSIFKLLGTPNKEDLHRIIGVTPHKISQHKAKSYSRFLINEDHKNVLGDQYCVLFDDLLKHMICLDPKKRYSCWECINHKFFDIIDFDEYKMSRQLQIYPIFYNVIKPYRCHNMSAIHIIKSLIYAKGISLRCAFLALDLYYRVIHELGDRVFAESFYVDAAYTVSYIAIKYIHSETVKKMKYYFPKITSQFLELHSKLEFHIINKLLKGIIYRALIWDLLYSSYNVGKLVKEANILFHILTMTEIHHNKNVNDIAKTFCYALKKAGHSY